MATTIIEAIDIVENWFSEKGWKSFPFQKETWKSYLAGKSGLINAPTGSGKTYAIGLAVLIQQLIIDNSKKGLKVVWITPIRALSLEIQYSLQKACDELGTGWRVEIRTGDTKSQIKQRQKKNMPEILVTTPESLHVLLSNKESKKLFGDLRAFIVDEWHDLLGSKRAVQVELALSWIKSYAPKMQIWGISATIGNLAEAKDVLLGPNNQNSKIIRAEAKKEIEVISIIPNLIEKLPWSGHYGKMMVDDIIPIIAKSQSTLLFTNTRAQCEVWYQSILQADPTLAGQMAMHHGSLSKEIRFWVENELHSGTLRLVVCTSSLDLGVDFRPVETIIQVGSPKGVARFMQRAGRSNHRPGQKSKIYFVPTHALELVEAAALRDAVKEAQVEVRFPYIRSFDVLMQYCMTLAISDGFYADQLFEQIRNTFSFQDISREEFNQVINFLVYGGDTLGNYKEFHKLVKDSTDGRYYVDSRRVAMRHRLSIGTIVSDLVFKVKYQSGGFIGTIEEWFITRLKPGSVFWFAGRNLELVQIKGLEARVKNTKKKNGQVPSWMGGRMPLSSQMSSILRLKLSDAANGQNIDPELKYLTPLINLQNNQSIIPNSSQFLIEKVKTKEGYHVFLYPFEGRFVHEGLGAIFAYRISQIIPISFTIAYNDYGIELLSDQEIQIEKSIELGLFNYDDLYATIIKSINASEMAQLKFRDIAVISGMVFKGLPGKELKEKHLQASSSLIFKVLNEHDDKNLLLRQAYEEVFQFQLEENRMREALRRINTQKVIIKSLDTYSPLSFPILVDRLRQKMSNEQLSDKIKKMQIQRS